MRGPVTTLLAALCAAFAGAALLLSAASGADPGATFGQRAQGLRQRSVDLAARSRSAELSLYALDSRLDRARAELGRLQARLEALGRERADVSLQLGVAERVLTFSQRQLGDRLRALYEEGDSDPLAVILGATSLDEALTGLDGLSRAAGQNRLVIAQTSSARLQLRQVAGSLAAQDAQLQRLEAAVAASTASLTRARAERARYLAQVVAERQLDLAQIGSLEARARAAELKADTLAAQEAASASTIAFVTSAPLETANPLLQSGAAAAAPGRRTLTVVATGYALGGATATGIPVGWGVVAVDPALIPLGTRLTIPGYGEGVAADTGAAVRGATIDLWFPSVAQAFAWGRRTVTIALH